MKRLIYFDGLGRYLRYDNLLHEFELSDDFSNSTSSIYQYWFTIDEVGSVLFYDFGSDGEVIR